MEVETELKLRIAPEELARLRRHPLVRKYQITRPVTHRLYNIYFDTPKLELHQAAMALRLRRVAGKWMQTLKGGGSDRAGLHQRYEWEVPVSSAVLDFSSNQTAEWKKYLPQRKKLQPIFVTDFYRTSRMLEWRGAQIELCMDHGKVSANQHSAPICELELELKSGEPQHLFELALQLLEIAPLELEPVSKAEHGYRLLSGYTENPLKGEAPVLYAKDTTDEALQKLVWSCLSHLQGNLRGAMSGDDTEYLHQMRVALRRLRVVLRMVRKFRADESLSALYQEASALCVELGQIREWDVFISQTVKQINAQMAGHAGLKALLTACEIRRAAHYAELRSAKQAHELQRLILRLAMWMSSTYRQQDGMTTVQDFATCHLHKLAKRYTQSVRQLDTLDDSQLHALRILAKKLRYSVEFFAALFDRQKARLFLSSLSKVQELLGLINDAAVANLLLDELGSSTEATALVKGWIAHDRQCRLIELRKAVRIFNKQPRFWKI